MRILVQRVRSARVEVEGETVGEIRNEAHGIARIKSPGEAKNLLLFVGVGPEDTEKIAELMAAKVANLRVLGDDEGKMNLSVLGAGGQALAVSQFTLYGDCRKGRRPSFIGAAPPEQGLKLFDHFVLALRSLGVSVATGEFGAMMDVHLVNAGPVTIWLDSQDVINAKV